MSVKEVQGILGEATLDRDLKDKIKKEEVAQIEKDWGTVPDRSVVWLMRDEKGDLYQVLFKDDKVIAKRQVTNSQLDFGLLAKDPPVAEKLTQKTVNQIKKGMSRADVEKLLGPGEETKEFPGATLWRASPTQHLIIYYDDNNKVDEISKKGFR